MDAELGATAVSVLSVLGPADAPHSAGLAETVVALELLTTLAADEAAALQGMAVQGWSFAELCGELAHLGEQAPAQAVSWLRQWLADGLLQRADHFSR